MNRHEIAIQHSRLRRNFSLLNLAGVVLASFFSMILITGQQARGAERSGKSGGRSVSRPAASRASSPRPSAPRASVSSRPSRPSAPSNLSRGGMSRVQSAPRVKAGAPSSSGPSRPRVSPAPSAPVRQAAPSSPSYSRPSAVRPQPTSVNRPPTVSNTSRAPRSPDRVNAPSRGPGVGPGKGEPAGNRNSTIVDALRPGNRPGERTPAAIEGRNTIGWLATPLRRPYTDRNDSGYRSLRSSGPSRSYEVPRGYAYFNADRRCDERPAYRRGYRSCYRQCGPVSAYRRCYGNYPYYNSFYYPLGYSSYYPGYYYPSTYYPDTSINVYGDYIADDPESTSIPYSAPPTQTQPSVPYIPEERAPEIQPSPESGAVTEPPLVAKGRQAFASGRYEEARDVLLRFILTDDRDGYAKLLYALSSVALGELDEGAAALRGALTDAQDLASDPLDLRELYSEPSDLDRHMNQLREALSVAGPLTEPSETDDARFLLGYLLFASARPGEAREIFDELLVRHSEDELLKILRDAAVRVAK